MSKHFKDHETKCKCGCGLDLMEDFKVKLDAYRDLVGFSLTGTSGARCPAHNEASKGSETSYHMKRRAMDLNWEDFDGAKKAKMLEIAIKHFGGIGLHKKFLHVDDRALKTVWFY
jgi:zinc D-Ala-D-Ala carboxypeptidase